VGLWYLSNALHGIVGVGYTVILIFKLFLAPYNKPNGVLLIETLK